MITYRGYTIRINDITGLPDIYMGNDLISAGYLTHADAEAMIDHWVEGAA